MHIETTVNPVRIICESRHLKALVVFSQAEFYFVTRCPHLTGNEKIIWYILAHESMDDPELSSILSYQYLADRAGQKISSVVEALQRLHKMGYIGAFDEEKPMVFKYQLSLPLDGLLRLKREPKLRDFDDKAFVECYRAGKNPFSPPLETFPIPRARNR